MSSPEFKAALARYTHLEKTLGHDHDITRAAFTVLFSLAPDEYVEEAHKIAVEMDLLPDATGYLADGTPMFSLNAIAAKLGLSNEDAEQSLFDLMNARRDAGLPVDGVLTDDRLIHRRQ